MTGLEKIKEAIKAESEANVKSVISEAEARAEEIRSEILAEADREVARIRTNAENQVADLSGRTESALDLEKRRALLTAKQEIIRETIDSAQEKILGLSTDAYFKGMLSLIKKSARPQAGQITFNPKDLSRMPSGFEAEIAKVLPSGGSLTVSKETADIDGGFLLTYGGALENCSISALFEANREELTDKVREHLFG